jgi:hypothetical protein
MKHNQLGYDVAAQHAREAVSLSERRSAYKPPRRRKTQPNERLQRLALALADTARETTEALTSVTEELSTLGYAGTQRSSEKVSGGGGGGSTAERDATRAHQLKEWREDVRDMILGLERDASALRSRVSNHRPADAPAASGVGLCMDSHHGREGAGEWGRGGCTELPVSAGLCSRCYQAERAFRKEHGLDDRAEPAA